METVKKTPKTKKSTKKTLNFFLLPSDQKEIRLKNAQAFFAALWQEYGKTQDDVLVISQRFESHQVKRQKEKNAPTVGFWASSLLTDENALRKEKAKYYKQCQSIKGIFSYQDLVSDVTKWENRLLVLELLGFTVNRADDPNFAIHENKVFVKFNEEKFCGFVEIGRALNKNMGMHSVSYECDLSNAEIDLQVKTGNLKALEDYTSSQKSKLLDLHHEMKNYMGKCSVLGGRYEFVVYQSAQNLTGEDNFTAYKLCKNKHGKVVHKDFFGRGTAQSVRDAIYAYARDNNSLARYAGGKFNFASVNVFDVYATNYEEKFYAIVSATEEAEQVHKPRLTGEIEFVVVR